MNIVWRASAQRPLPPAPPAHSHPSLGCVCQRSARPSRGGLGCARLRLRVGACRPGHVRHRSQPPTPAGHRSRAGSARGRLGEEQGGCVGQCPLCNTGERVPGLFWGPGASRNRPCCPCCRWESGVTPHGTQRSYSAFTPGSPGACRGYLHEQALLLPHQQPRRCPGDTLSVLRTHLLSCIVHWAGPQPRWAAPEEKWGVAPLLQAGGSDGSLVGPRCRAHLRALH